MKCLWMDKVCKNEKTRESMLAGVILIVTLAFLVLIIKSRELSIASVDIEKVVNAHPAMREAIDSFQKEISDRQKQLDKMKEEEKLKQQQKMQQEISQLAVRLQQEAMDKVTKDIEKIAKRKGYTYVMDKNAILVGGKDITDEILSVLKQQEKTEAEQKKVDVSEMPMIPVK